MSNADQARNMAAQAAKANLDHQRIADAIATTDLQIEGAIGLLSKHGYSQTGESIATMTLAIATNWAALAKPL